MGSETLASACCTSTGKGSDVDISGAIVRSNAAKTLVISGMIFSASTGVGTPLSSVCISSDLDALGASYIGLDGVGSTDAGLDTEVGSNATAAIIGLKTVAATKTGFSVGADAIESCK